jgi:hypothetical protein
VIPAISTPSLFEISAYVFEVMVMLSYSVLNLLPLTLLSAKAYKVEAASDATGLR